MPSITDDLIDGAKERDQAFYLVLQATTISTSLSELTFTSSTN
jgi:hypothetical protein